MAAVLLQYWYYIQDCNPQIQGAVLIIIPCVLLQFAERILELEVAVHAVAAELLQN